jgi:hypothetical protein
MIFTELKALLKMSHIILRYRSFAIVLNVHAPTEDKTDDMKASFTRNYKV